MYMAVDVSVRIKAYMYICVYRCVCIYIYDMRYPSCRYHLLR